MAALRRRRYRKAYQVPTVGGVGRSVYIYIRTVWTIGLERAEMIRKEGRQTGGG